MSVQQRATRIQIELKGASNYIDWVDCVKPNLQIWGLAGFLRVADVDYAHWLTTSVNAENDEKAQAVMSVNVCTELRREVNAANNARAAWKLLKDRYMPADAITRMSYSHELQALRQQPDETVDDFFRRVQLTSDRWTAAGAVTTEQAFKESLRSVLIFGLRDDFQTWRAAFTQDVSQCGTIPIDELRQRVHQEENRLRTGVTQDQQRQSPDAGSALSTPAVPNSRRPRGDRTNSRARGSQPDQQGQQSQQGQPRQQGRQGQQNQQQTAQWGAPPAYVTHKCNVCNLVGHTESHCWKHRMQRGQASSAQGQPAADGSGPHGDNGDAGPWGFNAFMAGQSFNGEATF